MRDLEEILSTEARLAKLAGPNGIAAWSIRAAGVGVDPPLVFVQHGATSRKERLLELCLRLADAGFHAVALDAPYHGDRRDTVVAPLLEDRYHPEFLSTLARTVRETVDEIAALADALGAGRFGVVGHSMGGIIALKAARTLPGAVAAVALNGTVDTDAPPFTLAPAEWRRDMQAESPFADPGGFFPTAVALLHGVDDSSLPIAAARRLQETLAPRYGAGPERLRLVEYPDVGHGIVPAMLDDTVAWMARFLR